MKQYLPGDARLEALLKTYTVQGPRNELNAQIMEHIKANQVTSPEPANDRGAKKWMRFGAIAALFIVSISLAYTQWPAATDDALWADAATDMGIDDLYEWVNG